MKRIAFYIVGNKSYVPEVEQSAESVKRILGLETHLFIPDKNVTSSVIDHITVLPPQKYNLWYLDSTQYWNMAVNKLLDYDQLLYLDSDTYICRDCSGIWRILDYYDMAMGHSASRGGTPSAIDCPSEFATLGIGANFFNNSPKMRAFFDDWLRMYEEHRDKYENNDEAPFRDLLFVNKRDIKYFVLAPEEHCRFAFGVWLNGSVTILHGRANGFTLPQVAEEINRFYSMRFYKPGFGDKGILWYHPY